MDSLTIFCSRYDKLSILIGKCRGQLSDFGYFFNPGSSSSDPAAADAAVQFQKGVFRTNCVDCLDRTNVVQSLLATENLKDVLKRMSILSPVDDIMRQNLFQVWKKIDALRRLGR